MDMNIEKEYKILLTKEQFYKLLAFYPSLSFVEQVNIYYDTKQGDIRNKKGAMRIRSKDQKHVFTLKMPSSAGLQEYECDVESNSVTSLEKEEILSLLHTYAIQPPFYELTKLVTQRAVYESEDAQLCFDISEYHGEIDYEIEYEYKRAHDGRTLFNEILSKIGVTYSQNCASKIARAMRFK